MPPLQNMGVGAELALVGGDQLGAVLGARRGLEVQQLQLAVAMTAEAGSSQASSAEYDATVAGGGNGS